MDLPTWTTQRWLTLCLTAWLVAATGALSNGQDSPSIRLNEKTVLSFSSVAQGRKLIGAHDSYIKRLGDLEIQLRMESAEPVTQQAYLKSLQASVVRWKQAEIDLVKTATETLRERMQNYRLPFPKQVHLIRVSSKLASSAPHCRGASVILPDGFFKNKAEAPVILAHELFHVLSSHNPKVRDQLYRIIHFERSNEVALPAALRAQRLTNPDAPTNEHVLQLMVEGQKTPVVPVLLAKAKEYRPGGLFANLDFKLMVLEKQDGAFVPKLNDGLPQLLLPQEAPDYMRQIGRNTGYIIHPEETLADNFWMMLLGSDRIRDAWVIDEMKKALKK